MAVFLSIYHAIVYVAVPLIMVSMLALSVYITIRVRGDFRWSAVAGLCAGFVAFATYVVSSFSNFKTPTLGLNAIPAFDWRPAVIGVVVGFGLLLLGRYVEVIRPGLVGLSVLFLSATSSTATFSYFFASHLRNFTIYLALGALFGLLLFMIIFPKDVQEGWRLSDSRYLPRQHRLSNEGRIDIVNSMPDFNALPTDVINFLLNLDRGRRIERPCPKCNRVTTQVVVSYGELSLLKAGEFSKIPRQIMGALDVVPGVPLILGKPTVCIDCGSVKT